MSQPHSRQLARRHTVFLPAASMPATWHMASWLIRVVGGNLPFTRTER
jgi:hypothetical protein